MKRRHVLVIDDEGDVRDLLRRLLTRAGYDVSEADEGRSGLRLLYNLRPDLIILDVRMPKLDGWQTLERIRDVSDVPVLMLTARAAELDTVRGLTMGADDYVAKPFGRQEFLARVATLLRRASDAAAEPVAMHADELLTIDFRERRVVVGGRDVPLTPLEFKLLVAFARHPNQVLTHEQLLDLVWGNAAVGSRDQVKQYVGYLRRKLLSAAPTSSPIETVRGVGYRYRPLAA